MSFEFLKRVLSSLILMPLTIFFVIKGSFIFDIFITTCFLIACYEWSIISKKKAYYIWGFIFLILSFYTIFKLRIDDYWPILFIVTICVAVDIGGYVFGKIFKGPKLTKLSPNKTYAGMIGSYIFSIVSGFIFINEIYLIMTPSFYTLLFIFLVSTTSQLGDIIVSFFKRESKIKDTGKIIPGHGGLLDRIDGMIFAFPVSYILFLIELF